MKYSACASPTELDVPGYYLLLPKTNWAPGCWCHHSHTCTVPFPQSGHQNLGILSSYQLHSSHTLVKQCSKFCKPGFSNTSAVNFQLFKLVLKKAKEPEIKLPTSAGSSNKQESSRKHLFLLYRPCQSLTVWITTNCGKFFKRWEYQTTWPASWEICMQARKQQLELDMEQQTGSK